MNAGERALWAGFEAEAWRLKSDLSNREKRGRMSVAAICWVKPHGERPASFQVVTQPQLERTAYLRRELDRLVGFYDVSIKVNELAEDLAAWTLESLHAER